MTAYMGGLLVSLVSAEVGHADASPGGNVSVIYDTEVNTHGMLSGTDSSKGLGAEYGYENYTCVTNWACVYGITVVVAEVGATIGGSTYVSAKVDKLPASAGLACDDGFSLDAHVDATEG